MKRLLLLVLCILKIGFIISVQQDSTPTLSRVYGDFFVDSVDQDPLFSQADYDAYLAQINQNLIDAAQGTIDFSFGVPTNYPGALVPCNGFSGAFLQQKVKAIRELPSGNFLVGMDGKLDSSNNVNMMLTQVTADGFVDRNFGNHGFLNLSLHNINENLVSAIQDFFLDLYVVGYSDVGSIVRKYNQAGAEVWIADNHVAGSYVTDVALQGTTRLLVAQQLSSQQGQLAAYDLMTGDIDTTFYADGVIPGVIDSPDFGLTIGQLYGVVISSQENIFIVYKNNITGHVDLAALYADGRSLISAFALQSVNPGVVYNIFHSISHIDNVRIGLDNYNNIIVAASTGQDLTIVRLDGQLGKYDSHFNSTGMVTISSVGQNVEIRKIIGLTDGSIIVAGYDQTTDTMLAIKITQAGQLDVDFNPEGDTPGISYFKVGSQQSDYYARYITGLAIQSTTGDLMLGGYQQRTMQGVIPIVSRLRGKLGTAGVASDLLTDMIPGMADGMVYDFSSIDGWEELLGYTAHAIHANKDGTMYVAFGNGINLIVGCVDATMHPVMTFGVNGIAQALSMVTVSNLVVDSQGRPIVAGSDLSENGIDLQQKIVRYTNLGAIDTEFAHVLPCSNGNSIAEQKSGQILVGGNVSGAGIICGYTNIGTGLIPVFGGVLLTGYHNSPGVDKFVVDKQDAVYLTYRNEVDELCLEKLMPNCCCKISRFNNGSTITTGIIAIAESCIAINADHNILVVAPTHEGIQFCLYDGQSGVALHEIQTIPGTDAMDVVTGVVGSGNDFVGFCSNLHGRSKVFRVCGSTGLLDVAFGALHNGVATIATDVDVYDLSIQLDGRIVAVGIQDQSPVLIRLHGPSYVNEYPQMPGKAPAGTLDTTLFYESPVRKETSGYRDGVGELDTLFGVFDFDSLSSGDFNLAGFTIKKIHTYDTGLMLFVCDNGIDTIIFRILNDVSLDTLANGGLGFNQVITPGYIKIVGQANPTGLYVDENGTIFLAGGSTISWARAYNSDGSILSDWVNPTENLSQGAYEVGVQSCGRRIVAGLGASHGMLYGYKPTGELDVEFGAQGVVSTGITSPIVDMSIDNLDRIVIVSVVGGSSVLQRVSAQGLTITTLNSGTSIADITGNQLKVALDVIGNIVIAAATTNGFTLRRYDSSGANNPATPVTIIAGGSGTSCLGNLYVTSDNKVGLVGFETTGNNIVSARLNASFVLDASFNGGIALITTNSPMNLVYDATVHVNNKIMIVGGGTITPSPYMARIFGDAYVAVLPQSPLQAAACTNDLSFGSSASNGVIFHALTGNATQNQVAQAIALQDEQNIVVALDGQSIVNTDSRIFINMFTVDGALQNSFGAAGKVEIPHTYGHEYVRDMVTFSQAGVHKAILAGYVTNSSASMMNALLLQYNLSTSSLDTNFGGFDGNLQGFASGQGQKFCAVAQQSNGRIIAAGLDKDGSGLLVGYTPQGKLDRSFGGGGIIRQGTTGIYTHIVDSQNRIVIAYNDGADRVAIARFVADGSSLDLSFNAMGATPGVITTSDMIAGIVGNNNFKIATDQNGKIVVAAVTNSGVDFVVKRYTADGIFDVGLIISSAMLGGTTSLTVAKLLIDQQGSIKIIGYDNGTSDHIVIVQLLADLSGLDSAANSADTPGYLKYEIASGLTQIVTDALIHPDGRILIIGCEN